MRRIKKILLGIILFFILFTVVGFFVVPPILKSILIKELSRALQREVHIREISINPYLLSATAKDVLVKEREEIAKGQPFFSLEELFVNLQSISALRRALIFKEIRIVRPHLYIKRNLDLTFNFSDLLKEKEEAPSEGKKKRPLLFSFNNIRIEDGRIDFWDEPQKTKHTIRELKIGIPFLSNIPYYIETFVEPSFSAKINYTPYELKGQTKPFHDSMETNFEIHIQELNIPYYLAYVPVKMNFKVSSALLDASLKIKFLQSKTQKSSFTISGDLSVKKIVIDELDHKPLLRIPSLDLTLASVGPLIHQFHLSRISVQSPEINVLREKDETLNLTNLFPEKKDKKPPKAALKEETPVLRIDVDEIQIKDGKIYFSDLSRSKPFKTILFLVEVKIDHFTNRKGEKTTYALTMNTESKESIELSGQFSLEPLWSEGRVVLKSIPLKKYSPYYQDLILCSLEGGKLDLSTQYRFAQGEKEPEIALSKLNLHLHDFRLKKTEEEEEFLRIPSLAIKETEVQLSKHEIRFGKIQTEKGRIKILRQKDGSIDLLQLLPSRLSPQEGSRKGKEEKDETSWLISLSEIGIDQYQLLMEDQNPRDPVFLTVEEIKFKGENLTTAKNREGKVSLSLLLNKQGRILTTGTLGIDPLRAHLKMELKEIPIPPFQPYITEKLRIHITKGTISTTGDFSFALSDKKEPGVHFKGNLSLIQFSSTEKRTGEELLKWDSLNLEDLRFDLDPLGVRIKGISLSDFYARILLYPEGKLNLQEIIIKEEPPKEPPPPSPEKKKEAQEPIKTSRKQIQIETITLQGGKIEFYDRSIDPPYSAKLVEIGGRLSGLSSEESTMADLELRGKLDEYAPLEIVGKINPLKEDLFVDLKVRFKDMDLTSMTPYSGKYVGYTIEKGKLSFDLKYLIEKRKLDSQNYIFLDQFTFGEKVESPHATKLPVKLAIALLKDRNGVIKLDIPVKGTLDDPKFSIWRIILQILINLIAKAATSPFALLGALIGGGEELSYVEFEEGTLTLNEDNLKKVENLSKALRERPAVKLEIEGHVDLEKDREGLKRELFLKKLKAQKLNEMIRMGHPSVSIEDIKIETSEYSKYLKMAYKEEKFPKPRNILGMIKDLPDPEMEKLMLTHIEVKEGDLRILAIQRAQKVKEMILKSKEIEPERIFLVEPKSLAPEKKDRIKNSRVDFKLK